MVSVPYFLAALTIINALLIGWVLLVVKAHKTTGGDLTGDLAGRFDGVDRSTEALRRTLTQMDQGLRKEIATGTRDGLAAAFDKVQEGTKAQADQLGTFGGELTTGLGKMQGEITGLSEKVTTALGELRGLVTEKLTEAETQAADGRSVLLRDTREAITQTREAIDKSLQTFGDQQGQRLQQAEQAVREGNTGTQSALTEFRAEVSARLDAVAERMRTGFDGFGERLREEQEQLREKVNGKLEEIRTGNEAKLEQMRQAVDEQLQSALEKRIGESFQRVAEQFAQVQQAIGQVQSVAGQVGDLKRLFSNVKSRGSWGEAQIQSLLDDVLPAGAYQCNLRIGDDSGETVEFALRMPLKGGEADVWLSIDAKFPTEDYDRLLLAGEAGDRDEEMAARKALERRIRDEARRISGKYIRPPRTVEFAVMYLATEGLFSEVSRMPGLVETLRRQHAVMVVGPGLLPALLHCIRVGHLTLALEKKAGAIGEILGAVKAEWGSLGKSLDTLARRAETLSNGIKDTQRRTRAVGKTLRTIDTIEFARAEQLLGLTPEATLIEVDAEEESGESGLLAAKTDAVLDDAERASFAAELTS